LRIWGKREAQWTALLPRLVTRSKYSLASAAVKEEGRGKGGREDEEEEAEGIVQVEVAEEEKEEEEEEEEGVEASSFSLVI